MYKISKSANASKLALASKIALATILLGFLFVGWGGASLQAQERKTGWFVGVSPYFLGAEIKTTTENTTLTEIVSEGTRDLINTDVAFTASTVNPAEGISDMGSLSYGYDATAINAVYDACEDGTYSGDGVYAVLSFDATSNTEPPGTVNPGTDIDFCYNHFQGLAASFSESLTGVILDSTSLSFSTTSENTPLTGNGLQLGYNFEKFRVSLNSHLWSAGESKLDSQLLLLDYFLPYGLYAGGGFGVAKLDTSIGSASKTAPALHFGYQHNFTNNFSLEAGLLWFGASFSLEKSAAAPEATISNTAATIPDSIDSSVLVGSVLTGLAAPVRTGLYFLDSREFMNQVQSAEDRRVLVTGTVTPIYSEASKSKTNETTPTKITHELEAPTSLFIRLVYSF